jgi:hypothetical protein
MYETMASLHVTYEVSGIAVVEPAGQMADRGWTKSWSIILGSIIVSADIRVTEALHCQVTIKNCNIRQVNSAFSDAVPWTKYPRLSVKIGI